MKMRDFQPEHLKWAVTDGVGVITLNRPAKKNPLTFDTYAELHALFTNLEDAEDVHVVIITGAEGNFSSGGDVFEIIGPLTKQTMVELLSFTRLTGSVVKAIRACPQPVIAAVDGICVGAGAILAMASDIRIASRTAKAAFLFSKVGLAGCDMGACAILPRLIGQGRASELLFTGRIMSVEEGRQWGFYNEVTDDIVALDRARSVAEGLADGPTFAHSMTKRMLNLEWNMSLDSAIESEAIAQALCMKTDDFVRAYTAFADKKKPVFQGN